MDHVKGADLTSIQIVEEAIDKKDLLSRNVSINFCHKYSGARLRGIGEWFGMSDAAVTQASRRMKLASESDATLRKLLDQVGKRLSGVSG